MHNLNNLNNIELELKLENDFDESANILHNNISDILNDVLIDIDSYALNILTPNNIKKLNYSEIEQLLFNNIFSQLKNMN